ncbi:MAG: hypothetical protein WCS17_11675, partial [Prevotella sp.]
KLKLLKFSRRIFKVMTIRTGLTEGFMPVEMLSDRKTKTIINYCRPQQDKKDGKEKDVNTSSQPAQD